MRSVARGQMAALAALATLALIVAIATSGCASAGVGGTQGAEGGQVAEATVVDEGVDTPCEASFAPISGPEAGLFPHVGDTIALIAPSSVPSQHQVDVTYAGLESWGYVPVLGRHVTQDGRTLDDCVEDLVWALEDPEVDAIFCIRGGYGGSEVMEALPAGLIESAGKLIIGYSDVTTYSSGWSCAHLPSVHACMSATFDGLADACVEAERRVLAGEAPTYTCPADGNCREGEAEGVLIGGNLATLTSVLGTAYDCTQTGEPYILFLEDIDENPMHIHRYLTVLRHLGVLDRACGIVFGEWCGVPVRADGAGGIDSRGDAFASVDDMVADLICQDLDIPVAFGFPAGHGDVNYPLIMGMPARLSVGPESYTLACATKAE